MSEPVPPLVGSMWRDKKNHARTLEVKEVDLNAKFERHVVGIVRWGDHGQEAPYAAALYVFEAVWEAA